MPRLSRRRGRGAASDGSRAVPTPYPIATPPAAPQDQADLRALAATEAGRLRAIVDRPGYERMEALEDLGSRLNAMAVLGPLADLARALRPDAIGHRPLAELWEYTLRKLDMAAAGEVGSPAAPDGPDRRGSFWRR